jgi:hypothetical protein
MRRVGVDERIIGAEKEPLRSNRIEREDGPLCLELESPLSDHGRVRGAPACTSRRPQSTGCCLGSEPFQDQLADHSSAFDGQVGVPQVFHADAAEVLRER